MKNFVLLGVVLWLLPLQAQLMEGGRTIVSDIPQLTKKSVENRSASKPTKCGADTSYFPSSGTTAYNSITIKKGSSLGQFFDAPSSMTVSGFRFFGFSVPPTPARSLKINIICNLYKAGADSLPSGSPLASDTITVDTVMGSTIPLSRIVLNADFGKAVSVTTPYIIVVESDSTSALAAVVSNSWANGDGKKRNLCVGSVSGKWYRCLSLNIGGVLFNSHMQMYPFVGYKLGADFSFTQNCYANSDTLYFANQNKKNVSGSIFYNYYVYANVERFSHLWMFDNSTYLNAVDGKFKPKTRKNIPVRLISTLYGYSGPPYFANRIQCADTSLQTIYFKPSTPSLYDSAKGCIGDTVSIIVTSDAQAKLQWFAKIGDPKPFFEGNKYTIYNVQKNDTFYVKAVNNTCESGWLTVAFSVNNYPTQFTIKNDSICAGATANLQANTNFGKLYWYDQATGGNLVHTGSVLQTGKLSKDTQFYVIANNNGCYFAGGPKQVKAFVGSSFAPSAPKVPSDTFVCARGGNNTVTLIAKSNGNDTLRWFLDATGGTSVAKGNQYSFKGDKRGENYVYVESWNGICGSGRSAIKINTFDFPEVFGAEGDTACSDDSARLFGSTNWGKLHWYMKKTDKTPFYSGKTPVLGGLKGQQFVYYKSSEGACFAGSFDSVAVIVNEIPIPLSTEAIPVCAKGLGIMKVTIPFGKVYWYEDTLATEPLYIGSTFNLGMVLSSRKVYYETENKACFGKRKLLELKVKPRPAAGFTWNLLWQHKLNCVPISTAGLSFDWDWGDGTKKTGLPGVHQYSNAGQYMVRLVTTSNSNGCKDTADISVMVDHTAVEDITRQQIRAYPNPSTIGSSVFLRGLGNASFTWIDPLGRIVDKGNALNDVLIVPLKLNPGLYYLMVNGSSRYYPIPLVIQAR